MGIAGAVLSLAGPVGSSGSLVASFGVLTALLSGGMMLLLARYRRIRSRARDIAVKIDHHPDVASKQALAGLGDQIDRLNLMDRDHHLIRLLKDESPNLRPILEELAYYGVAFPHDGFIIVAFNACRRQSMNPPQNFRTRDYLIRDYLEQSFAEGAAAFALDLEDLYVCLFNVPYTTESARVRKMKKDLDEFAEGVLSGIESSFGICSSASVSELHEGLQSLTEAFIEVQGLFEYRNITGNPSRVIQYTDYYVSFDSWYEFGNTYHKFDEVRQLITSIQVGDFSNAKFLINELIENDYSRMYPSLLLARCRLYGIIDAAINAMGLLKEELDADFLRELDPTTRIVNCSSYAELKSQLDSIFDAIIRYYSLKKKDSPPEWFETIRTYIDKHYNDAEINVATIADHFKISSAYYARVFKKYTGMSPLDYIHKLRMRSAKRLMAKGVSVKDAATIVGYGSPITMSRAFKRYEGVTPGSYLKR